MSEKTVERLYMSVKEAAIRYSVSERTIYRIIDIADSPQCLKFGNKLALPIKAFDEFMVENYTHERGLPQ